ncbi:hypothetical protein BDQ17DRAFT_1254288, partial [Cyathus striatus]
LASHEDFFRYTSGRWIHDEERKQALRYQRFNVDALKSVITESTGADGVTDIRKVAEGGSNKVFRVQLTDGREVIARIPTSLSGPPHLVTASEVATMQFLRDRLGLTQVPRVLSSSSSASDTSVGAEYIIMDVADGIELHTVWHQLTMKQKLRLVNQWIKFESKINKVFTSGGYGSLYYRKDIPAQMARDVFVNAQKDDEFVLGPSTLQTCSWENSYGSPTDICFDRGPWPDVPSYLKGITNSERAWITRYAKAPTRKFDAPWDPPSHLQVPQDHIRLLNMYDEVASYFIPKDERLLRPSLTLCDSNQTNIFLSREAYERDGTMEISAVIDWQNTAVHPLYIAALIPYFIEEAEPASDQKKDAFLKEQAYLRKAYHALYQETELDIVWASALSFGEKVNMAQQLPTAVQYCWHGSYRKLKRLLIRTMVEWEAIAGPGVACPISPGTFTEQDIAQVKEDELAWQEMEKCRSEMRRCIGVVNDGWVDTEGYDRALQANDDLRKQWMAIVDSEELEAELGPGEVDYGIWPYQGAEK